MPKLKILRLSNLNILYKDAIMKLAVWEQNGFPK
jgi:hypothetical protein